MIINAVNDLSTAGVKYEKSLRATRQKNMDYVHAIERVAESPTINNMGYYHIDTAPFRERAAQAQLLVEQAHALICQNHQEFNQIARVNDIEVQPLEGGR